MAQQQDNPIIGNPLPEIATVLRGDYGGEWLTLDQAEATLLQTEIAGMYGGCFTYAYIHPYHLALPINDLGQINFAALVINGDAEGFAPAPPVQNIQIPEGRILYRYQRDGPNPAALWVYKTTVPINVRYGRAARFHQHAVDPNGGLGGGLQFFVPQELRGSLLRRRATYEDHFPDWR